MRPNAAAKRDNTSASLIYHQDPRLLHASWSLLSNMHLHSRDALLEANPRSKHPAEEQGQNQHNGLRQIFSGNNRRLVRCCREVGVLCFVKFSGALVWGAADVLQVKYSAMPSMQTLGDSSQTLGFVFAAVGVGCFFGPILFNFFTPPRSVVPFGLRWLALTQVRYNQSFCRLE